MGTDIHLYIERCENGKWICCDIGESTPFCPERDYDVGVPLMSFHRCEHPGRVRPCQHRSV
jgi:hypothetical protein